MNNAQDFLVGRMLFRAPFLKAVTFFGEGYAENIGPMGMLEIAPVLLEELALKPIIADFTDVSLILHII